MIFVMSVIVAMMAVNGIEAECTGTPRDVCRAITNVTRCTTTENCRWDDFRGNCVDHSPDCDTHETAESCNGVDGCAWNEPASSVMAIAVAIGTVAVIMASMIVMVIMFLAKRRRMITTLQRHDDLRSNPLYADAL